MKNNPFGIPFDKPPLSNKEIIRLLSERGMIIDNPERAEHYLDFISYYRLSVYMLPFQEEHHSFKTPVSFDNECEVLVVFFNRLKQNGKKTFLMFLDIIENGGR